MGPPFPLYSAGAKLVQYHCMGLLTPGGGLFHAVFSMTGKVSISALACRNAMPDPEFYKQCLVESFEELKAAVKKKYQPVNVATKKKTPQKKKVAEKKAAVKKKSAKKASAAVKTKKPITATKKPKTNKKAIEKEVALKKKTGVKTTQKKTVISNKDKDGTIETGQIDLF
jgi:hypothetical protein